MRQYEAVEWTASSSISRPNHQRRIKNKNCVGRVGGSPVAYEPPLPPNKDNTTINHQRRGDSPGEGAGGLIFWTAAVGLWLKLGSWFLIELGGGG